MKNTKLLDISNPYIETYRINKNITPRNTKSLLYTHHRKVNDATRRLRI